MMVNESTLEHISKAVIRDSLPVTCLSLAIELKLDVEESKKILEEFYQNNKGKVNATYLIVGETKNGKKIKLSHGEESLSQDSEEFENIECVEVYSIISNDIENYKENIALHQLKYSSDLTDIDGYLHLGVIRGPALVELDKSVQKTSQVKSEVPRIHEKEKMVTKQVSNLQGNKDKVDTSPRPAARAKTNLGSYYTSRKGEATKGTAKRSFTAPAKSTYVYKSRKTEKSQPKERVIVSSVDTEPQPEEKEQEEPEKKKQEKYRSDLNDLFIDDDFSEDENSQPEKENEEPILVSSNTTSSVAHKRDQSSPNPASTEKIKTSTPPPHAAAPAPPPSKKDSVDSDGYITSYRANNPVAGSTKKKANQSSLMGFFKPQRS